MYAFLKIVISSEALLFSNNKQYYPIALIYLLCVIEKLKSDKQYILFRERDLLYRHKQLRRC